MNGRLMRFSCVYVVALLASISAAPFHAPLRDDASLGAVGYGVVPLDWSLPASILAAPTPTHRDSPGRNSCSPLEWPSDCPLSLGREHRRGSATPGVCAPCSLRMT